MNDKSKCNEYLYTVNSHLTLWHMILQRVGSKGVEISKFPVI